MMKIKALRLLLNTTKLSTQEKIKNLLYVMYYPECENLLFTKDGINRNFVIKEIDGNPFYNEKIIWMYNEGTPNKGELVAKITYEGRIEIISLRCQNYNNILKRKDRNLNYIVLVKLLEEIYNPRQKTQYSSKLSPTNAEFALLLKENNMLEQNK